MRDSTRYIGFHIVGPSSEQTWDVTCPACGQLHNLHEHDVGIELACAKCGQAFRLDDPLADLKRQRKEREKQAKTAQTHKKDGGLVKLVKTLKEDDARIWAERQKAEEYHQRRIQDEIWQRDGRAWEEQLQKPQGDYRIPYPTLLTAKSVFIVLACLNVLGAVIAFVAIFVLASSEQPVIDAIYLCMLFALGAFSCWLTAELVIVLRDGIIKLHQAVGLLKRILDRQDSDSTRPK